MSKMILSKALKESMIDACKKAGLLEVDRSGESLVVDSIQISLDLPYIPVKFFNGSNHVASFEPFRVSNNDTIILKGLTATVPFTLSLT